MATRSAMEIDSATHCNGENDGLQTEHGRDASVVPNNLLLDPVNTERRIYREEFSGHQREIWRPGDADGDQGTDYYERIGPALPIEKRWRLFQCGPRLKCGADRNESNIGVIDANNQPPRFVLLDDRAVYEVLKSDIQRIKLAQNWPHDFAGGGKVRARRPHRGRSAVKNPAADGNAKFFSATPGGKQEHYFFTGEKDYQSVDYFRLPQSSDSTYSRKRKPGRDDVDYNPRGHGHNQYTPKDLLVKHGAKTFSNKKEKLNPPLLKSLMRRERTPPPRDEDRRPYGGLAPSLERDSPQSQVLATTKQIATGEARSRGVDDGETLFIPDFEVVRATPGCSGAPGFNASDSLTNRDDGFESPNNVEETLIANMRVGVHREDSSRLVMELSQAERRIAEQARQIQRLKELVVDQQRTINVMEAATKTAGTSSTQTWQDDA